MKLIFASQNYHKLEEIKGILPVGFELMIPKDLGITDEIPETGLTLQDNALQKAQFIAKLTDLPVFADDTGLEVDALEGRPGVYSARYAGEQKDPAENRKKILIELSTKSNRKARFRTVIAYCNSMNTYFFEGIIQGTIHTEERGIGGFGYDPIFIPEGYTSTFAEMSAELKNSISHRGLATQKFITFLRNSVS